MGVKFSNNAEGTLAAGINASVTTLTLNAGEGAYFPVVASGPDDFFYATLTNVAGQREVIKVTQHSAGDTLQVIERAVDSIQEEAVPTAYAFSTNDTCQIRLPKIALEGFDLGTNETNFQIDVPNTGPRLKNNSNDLQIRNDADSAYANLEALGLTLAGALVIAGTATGITNLTASGSLTAASLALAGAITGVTTLTASGAITALSLALTGAITGATNITASGTVQAEQITSTDDITASGTITGEHIVSTDDMSVQDNLEVLGDVAVSGEIVGQIDNEATSDIIHARDHGTASVDEVVNVCYGTGSPPTASTTTIGTLFIKYVA